MAAETRPELTRSPATAVAIGLVAGIFSALLGVGGGLLMVPAMVYMLNVRQHRAHGTSLVVILPTAIAGVSQYAREGHLDWRVALYLAIGGVIGAMYGAKLANRLKAPALKRAFGIFVVTVGMVMVATPDRFGSSGGGLLGQNAAATGVLFAGLIAGVVSGLLGVGGGIIMVPAMVFLLGLSQHAAQGISLAVIIPVSLSGALIHYRKGNVISSLALPLSIGAVLGAYVTAHWVGRIQGGTLRLLFGIFLIAVGVSMVGRPRRRGGSSRGCERA
jgi:uncharacterized membrane protein YfcA